MKYSNARKCQHFDGMTENGHTHAFVTRKNENKNEKRSVHVMSSTDTQFEWMMNSVADMCTVYLDSLSTFSSLP